jgi:hypothetical protein
MICSNHIQIRVFVDHIIYRIEYDSSWNLLVIITRNDGYFTNRCVTDEQWKRKYVIIRFYFSGKTMRTWDRDIRQISRCNYHHRKIMSRLFVSLISLDWYVLLWLTLFSFRIDRHESFEHMNGCSNISIGNCKNMLNVANDSSECTSVW